MTTYTVTPVEADTIQVGDTILRYQTNPYRPTYALRVVARILSAPKSVEDRKDLRFVFDDGGSVYYAINEEVLTVAKRSRWRR